MELVERYLQAVAGYLPKAQADDIVNELRDGLLSRAEEQEARLRRALTTDEQAALLKERGHPLLVATSFLPQQSLVGPALYPYWRLGLRYVLVVAAVLQLVEFGLALDDGRAFVQVGIQAAAGFVGTAISLAGLLALVLGLAEHSGAKITLLDDWSPAQLPPRDELLRISRAESLAGVVFGLVVLGWWSGLVPTLVYDLRAGSTVPVALSAAWQPWYLPIFALLVANVGLAAINFVLPCWDRGRVVASLMVNATAVGIALALVAAGPLVEGAAGTVLPARLETTLDWTVRVMLVVIAGFAAFDTVQALRRLRRLARA